jgi:hypothetical protein
VLTAGTADDVAADKVTVDKVAGGADDLVSVELMLADVNELVKSRTLENGGNCIGGLASLHKA